MSVFTVKLASFHLTIYFIIMTDNLECRFITQFELARKERVLVENRFTVNSWFRHTSADRQILATWRIGCVRECQTSRVIFKFWVHSIQPKIPKFWPEIKFFGPSGILKFGTTFEGGPRDRSNEALPG